MVIAKKFTIFFAFKFEILTSNFFFEISIPITIIFIKVNPCIVGFIFGLELNL